MKLPGLTCLAVLCLFVPGKHGIWVPEQGSEPPQWFDSVQDYGSDVSKHVASRGIKVMLVGDSIDRFWFYAACSQNKADIYHSQACGVTDSSQHYAHAHYSPECARNCVFPSGAELFFVHILGVALDQPFGYDQEGNYMQRINFVMEFYGMNGTSVSAVIVSSLFWDLLRLDGLQPELQESNVALLPYETLKIYKQNCTSMLQWISALGFQAIIFHTTRPTVEVDSVSTTCRPSYIAQINDVARQVTKQLGWTLFDFEEQLNALPVTMALRDHHHPQDWFFIQSTNRIMAVIHEKLGLHIPY